MVIRISENGPVKISEGDEAAEDRHSESSTGRSLGSHKSKQDVPHRKQRGYFDSNEADRGAGS